MKFTRKKKIISGLILVPVLGLGLAACSTGGGAGNGNQQESQQQQADTNTLENNQPLPSFHSSQERQNMIDIETAQANDVETTTFWMNMGNPDPIGSCPSIGFGIPDTASLSNPWQIDNQGQYGGGNVAIGQMDPTGIYTPASSAGTFIICLTESGQPYIDRIESNTDTLGGPAVWDYTKHSAKLVGAPTAAANVTTNVPTSGEHVKKALKAGNSKP